MYEISMHFWWRAEFPRDQKFVSVYQKYTSTKIYRCNITHVMLISFLDTLFHGVYFLHVAGGMLLCMPLGSLMPFLCPLAVVALSMLALYLECGCPLVICQSPSEWVELLQDIRVTFYQEMT